MLKPDSQVLNSQQTVIELKQEQEPDSAIFDVTLENQTGELPLLSSKSSVGSELQESQLQSMRLAFGSEQKIREQSSRTIEELNKSSSQNVKFILDMRQVEEVEKKESFQEFSYRKFTELMNPDQMSNFLDEVQKTCREYKSELENSISD